MPTIRPIPPLLAIAALTFPAASELSAQIPAAEAQAYLGAWEAEMQAAQGGTFDFEIFLRDQDGQLAGEVTSPQGDTDAIEQFALTGVGLVLGYAVNFGGQRSNIRVTLTPNATGLQVILEMPGFTADGMAQRVEEEAQPPQPAQPQQP
jgi:hypothetical protein